MFCNPLNFITDIKYVKILILSHCLYIWMFINLKFKKKKSNHFVFLVFSCADSSVAYARGKLACNGGRNPRLALGIFFSFCQHPKLHLSYIYK